jgi:hypothetical protein
MKLKKYERKTEERKKENNMSNFDYDKIKDMEYDPDRGRYVGKSTISNEIAKNLKNPS